MAIKAAELFVKVGADTREAEAGLSRVDKGVKAIGEVGKASLAKLGGAVIGAGAGLTALGGKALNVYQNFERMGASLQQLAAKEKLATGEASSMEEALLMTAEAGEELLEWTQKLAIESPFSQEGVNDAFKMAMAYGFNTQEAKRLTQAMIDFASGTGATEASMSRIALALGQIQAKGKLAGGEVLQLTEAGLNVNQILADAFGKTTAEIVAMREDGLIPADTAIEAIVQSLERDFGGAAARQSDTIAGLVNSLGDLRDIGLREFFGPLFREFQPDVQKFADTLQDPKTIQAIRDLGQQFADTVRGMVEDGKQVIDWWNDLEDATKGTAVALGLLALNGPAVVKVVGGLYAMFTGLPALVGAVATGWQAWNAGLTLTTALGAAGITPIAISLGAVGAALASVVGVWITWNETIAKTNRLGSEAVGGAMADFLADLREQGAGAIDLIDEFVAGYGRMKGAVDDSGFAGVFVNRTQLAKESLGALSDQLYDLSGSYEEYRDGMLRAMDETGVYTKAQWELHVAHLGEAGALEHLSERYGLLTGAQWDASHAAEAERANAEAARRATEGWTKATYEAYRGIITLADGTKASLADMQALKEIEAEATEVTEDLWEAQEKLNDAQLKWNQQVAGDAVGMLRELGIEGEAYKLALGGIDEVMGTNYLTQQNFSEELKAITEEYKKTGDLETYKTKIRELGDTYRDELGAGIREAQLEVDRLQLKLNNLKSKEIEITVRINQVGSSEYVPTVDNTPVYIPPDQWKQREVRETGGPVAGGQAYIWNERGSEILMPAGDGYVMDAQKSSKLLDLLERFMTYVSGNHGGGNGGGGGLVIFQKGAIVGGANADARDIAYQVAELIQQGSM